MILLGPFPWQPSLPESPSVWRHSCPFREIPSGCGADVCGSCFSPNKTTNMPRSRSRGTDPPPVSGIVLHMHSNFCHYWEEIKSTLIFLPPALTAHILTRSCVKHALISSCQIFQASTSGIPSTVGSFQTHQLEVSLRHTSQHKQFGTCDVTSIQPRTRQMPSLLCRFAVLVPRAEITSPRSGMPTDDRTVGKEQRICYQWQRAVMDFSRKNPQHGRKGLATRSLHNIHITADINTRSWE